MLISFFPKINYRFEQIDFFLIIKFGFAISLCHVFVPRACHSVRDYAVHHNRFT